MKIENIDVLDTIEKAKNALAKDNTISNRSKIIFNLLITIISLLVNKLKLNSTNSSKPPSTDNKGEHGKKKKKKSKKRPGGQPGHNGTTLKPVDNPDEIKDIKIDKRKLPKGMEYAEDGYISRQVINIKISRIITEYRAQILLDELGNQYVADFPKNITRPIQYGSSIKASVIYASVYQLIPYERTQDQFKNEYAIPISTGTLSNFNVEASDILYELGFDDAVKRALIQAKIAHADETSINVSGKKIWLHDFSNEQFTYFAPHAKRGIEAMNDIGIIHNFFGLLCHDHWKPYFNYEQCQHILCNAHHLRELTRAFEQDGQMWAEKMHGFLVDLNKEVDSKKKKKLSKAKSLERRKQYRKILQTADKECPAKEPKPGTKRRPAQTKARNLLERLRDYETEVLRFMVDPLAPFTNNQGERDIRMTKVQQKISGCFRSMNGAINYCRIRSYLSTCQKHGMTATDALNMIFDGELPRFLQQFLDSS